MQEILFTIVPQKHLVMTNDRVVLSRSAMFLVIFIIVHTVGNLHVFLGPDGVNGYCPFYFGPAGAYPADHQVVQAWHFNFPHGVRGVG